MKFGTFSVTIISNFTRSLLLYMQEKDEDFLVLNATCHVFVKVMLIPVSFTYIELHYIFMYFVSLFFNHV